MTAEKWRRPGGEPERSIDQAGQAITDQSTATHRHIGGAGTASLPHQREIARVKRFLDSALIDVLGALLAEEQFDSAEVDRFFCPSCQRDARRQVQHEPAAYAVGATRWKCTRCARTGTRWDLVHVVWSRESAYDRLLDAALGEGVVRHG